MVVLRLSTSLSCILRRATFGGLCQCSLLFIALSTPWERNETRSWVGVGFFVLPSETFCMVVVRNRLP